jgi:hypothetical protein
VYFRGFLRGKNEDSVLDLLSALRRPRMYDVRLLDSLSPDAGQSFVNQPHRESLGLLRGLPSRTKVTFRSCLRIPNARIQA